MKKYLILLFIIIAISFLVKVPGYNDLNNIVVIDKIDIKCIGREYHVSLREVSPIKEDNSISYKYIYHNEVINGLDDLKVLNMKKYHNNLYYDHAMVNIKNC